MGSFDWGPGGEELEVDRGENIDKDVVDGEKIIQKDPAASAVPLTVYTGAPAASTSG